MASLESEVFLLGHWKNYEELEDNLSMPELLSTLEAFRDEKDRDRQFLAALQGVDLNLNNKKTGEDVVKNARAKAAGVDANDVVSLQGKNADEAGFGIGLGLGYEVE